MAPPKTGATSRIQRSRTVRLLLAVAVTVPLAFSALYMWMMWDPTETVNAMPVALVNNDQPAIQNGQRIDAGAEVAHNLLESGALGFEEVDHSTAIAGLNSDDYYFVVEIPENFSTTLATIGVSASAPALINVIYNDNNTLKASSIGAAAMSAISAAVLQGVASTTVGTVLTGVDTLGEGLRDASVGSQQLSDGTGQLTAGIDTLATGLSSQLAPGVSEAAAGSAQLASGARQLSGGLSDLRDGTDQLGSGAGQIADGIESLTDTVDIDSVGSAVEQVRNLIPAAVASDPTFGQVNAGLDQIVGLLEGLGQLREGSRRLATELTDPGAPYRQGVNQLVDGGQQLDTGAQQLAAGMSELDAGTQQASAGALELQAGAHRLDDGAHTLSAGLAAGTEQLPAMGDQTQQQSLASLLSTPVSMNSRNLAQAQFFGPGAAPALFVIVSALVSIVVFMCFRTHTFVTGSESARSLRAVARRAAAVSVISLVVMALVGVALWTVLSPSPTPYSLPQVITVVAFATVMNVAITSALFTLFGYVAGALISLASLMLQVFTYGGVWMVETLPRLFQLLHPLAPMTYVREGLISGFNGAPGLRGGLAIMVLITALAITVNVVACRFRRRSEQRLSVDDPTTSGIRPAEPSTA